MQGLPATNCKSAVVRADCYKCVTSGDICEDCNHPGSKFCMRRETAPDGRITISRSGANCPHGIGCTFFHMLGEYVTISREYRLRCMVPACRTCIAGGKMCDKCVSNPKLCRCQSILDRIRNKSAAPCSKKTECTDMHPAEEVREFYGGKLPHITILKSTVGVVPSCSKCTRIGRACVDHMKTPQCGMGRVCTKGTGCENIHTLPEWKKFVIDSVPARPPPIDRVEKLAVELDRMAATVPPAAAAAKPPAAAAPAAPPFHVSSITISVLEEKIRALMAERDALKARVTELEATARANERMELAIRPNSRPPRVISWAD